ncbi:UNVERIFIED_CONTAM: hypothetical protein FKN15_016365 [Acipenser sinensis]
MDLTTGAVIPPNFVHTRFVLFTCDNIDINDTSFDGKNSFHATQMAGSDDAFLHNESTKSRQKRDSQDKDNLLTTLQTFNLFSSVVPEDLQNNATKYLATKQIEEDLLEAQQKGQKQLNTFIEERLLPCDERQVKFGDPLPKNETLIFSHCLRWDIKIHALALRDLSKQTEKSCSVSLLLTKLDEMSLLSAIDSASSKQQDCCGFSNEESVESSDPEVDTEKLEA